MPNAGVIFYLFIFLSQYAFTKALGQLALMKNSNVGRRTRTHDLWWVMKQQSQPQSPPKYPMGFEKVLEQRTLSRMWIVRRELFFIKNLFKSSKCFHSRKSSHGVWSAGHTTRYFHTKFSHSVFVFLNSLTSSLLILSLAYQCLISSEFSAVNYSTLGMLYH